MYFISRYLYILQTILAVKISIEDLNKYTISIRDMMLFLVMNFITLLSVSVNYTSIYIICAIIASCMYTKVNMADSIMLVSNMLVLSQDPLQLLIYVNTVSILLVIMSIFYFIYFKQHAIPAMPAILLTYMLQILYML